ncbi:UTRA domain-containing protein [Bifidobacterium dentium]|uniref:UTRA domain-containing protein n=1 Tax=Bifidobacterium dentium TaxID=1689 RepID=UPI003D17A245
MRVSSKVLQAVIAPASPSDIRLLKLPGEHPMVYDITRLRYIEDQPLSLERSHLPAYLFPMFLTRDLTTPFYTMFERAIDVYVADRMRFTMHHSGYVRLSATHGSAK